MMVPLTRPDIAAAEVAAVTEVLQSGWLTTGSKVAELERVFGEACGGHAVAVSSCTAAMHLALASRLNAGARVVVPVWTFSATAEAIETAGMTPIFTDVDPMTLHALRVSDISYDAVLPVNMAGAQFQPTWCSTLTVIVDAAHSLPYAVGGNHALCFSFHANKPLTAGEGGMVVFQHEAHAEAARARRLHGLDAEAHNRKGAGHEIVRRGFKYNLTDIQAALVLAQMNRAEEMLGRRRKIAKRYREELRGCMLPPDISTSNSLHQFIVQVPDRDAFIAAMANKGIACGIHYEPLHRHRYWREKYDLKPEMFPGAEAARRHAVSLPIFSAMTEEQVDHVIKSAREILF